jgi:hypothetical protein
LTTTLRVLQGEARYVRNDGGRLIAFRQGVLSWRKQYGRQLASELARSYSTLRISHLMRKLLRLVNYYPQGLLMLILLRIMPTLSRRSMMAYFHHPVQAVPNLVAEKVRSLRRTETVSK